MYICKYHFQGFFTLQKIQLLWKRVYKVRQNFTVDFTVLLQRGLVIKYGWKAVCDQFFAIVFLYDELLNTFWTEFWLRFVGWEKQQKLQKYLQYSAQ